MNILSNILAIARPNSLSASIHELWIAMAVILPHLFILAGVLDMGWRASLVAKPADSLIVALLPIQTPPTSNASLVVVSANLKHDFPRYRDVNERLEAFAQLVEAQNADILLLQEVSRTRHLNVDEWLHRRLGMAYVYARANGHQAGIGFEEGVAIFSRFPISDPEVRELSSGKNPFARRIGVNASILLPGGKVEAFSVHLGIAPGGNEQQIKALKSWTNMYADESTLIVGGDFNAENHTDRIKAIQPDWTDTYLSAGNLEKPVTHTLSTPWGTPLREHRLDYIFLAGAFNSWKAKSTQHLETQPLPHSDHKVVVTKLEPVPRILGQP